MTENAERRLLREARAMLTSGSAHGQITRKELAARIDALLAQPERAAQSAKQESDTAKLYHELLYQVCTKHPGETRHETALRYIRQAENNRSGGVFSGSESCAIDGTTRGKER